MRYSLIRDEDAATITVYKDGEVLTANSDHPNFETIVAQVVTEGDVDVDLFDVSRKVAARLEHLSERVTVAGGHVFFDGDPVDNSLTNQILRFIEEEVEDFKPLVNFMEKLAQNPQEHSREQLYDWLTRHDFTIAPDGDIIAYKGVRKDNEGNYASISHGPAVVNGENVNGAVPNPIGAVVEMPRSSVQFNPGVGCASGLHCGNWRYAEWFARGAVLKVKVNPRDVVSVPTDSNWEKVRVCRYTVLEEVGVPVTSAVDYSLYEDDEYDEDYDGDDDVYTAPVSVTTPETDEDEDEEFVDYAAMGKTQLVKIAQSRHIRVDGRRPSYCTKTELVAALTNGS